MKPFYYLKNAVFFCLALASLNAWSSDVLIPASRVTDTTGGRYFTVSIGISTYQDDFWPPLKWPANDASRVANLLGGNTPYLINRTVLLDDQASLVHITQTLDNISKEVLPSDTVILYISAHGTLSQNESGDLEQVVVLHDTRKNALLATGLRRKTLTDWLDSLRSNKKMIVLATCHSGDGKSRLPPEVLKLLSANKGAVIPLADASEGSLILAAAAMGEPAREDDRLRGDVYTHYLLEALTAYDRNKDGTVSALEAHDYAKDRTWHYTDGNQRPTANVKLIGDADISLYGKRDNNGLPLLEAYDERLAGFQIQVDDNAKGTLPLAFPLNPQGSRVTLFTPADKPLASYRVKADPGETLTLHDVMNRRPVTTTLRYRRFEMNRDWERFTGQSEVFAWELGGRLAWKDFGFGLAYTTPITKKWHMSPEITSHSRLESLMFSISYSYSIGNMYFLLNVEQGPEILSLDFHDQTTGKSRRLRTQSDAFGTGVSVGYRLYPDIAVVLDYGRRENKWKFENLGAMEGERTWIGFGLDYRFGWNARTL